MDLTDIGCIVRPVTERARSINLVLPEREVKPVGCVEVAVTATSAMSALLQIGGCCDR